MCRTNKLNFGMVNGVVVAVVRQQALALCRRWIELTMQMECWIFEFIAGNIQALFVRIFGPVEMGAHRSFSITGMGIVWNMAFFIIGWVSPFFFLSVPFWFGHTAAAVPMKCIYNRIIGWGIWRATGSVTKREQCDGEKRIEHCKTAKWVIWKQSNEWKRKR